MRSFVLPATAALILGACAPQAPDGSDAPAPADAPPAAFSGDLDARGTEPFWALEIRARQITLRRPDHPAQMAANPGLKMSGDKAVWTTKTGETPLTVTLSAEPCSDGMSDLKYPYAAEVVLGGETLKGCAGRTLDMPKE